METERKRDAYSQYTIVTSFTLSARRISVCDCLLALWSFGVAVVVDGGWELLMVCV